MQLGVSNRLPHSVGEVGDCASTIVSVCIPTYNNATMIEDALRSVLAQTYPNLEVLVLDNHSTDETERLVHEIALSDSRVRYVRHAKNIGMAGNFNACLTMARGEFIQVLCADDILESGCVKELSTALRAHPEAVLACCGRTLVDANLQPLRVVRARSGREVVDGSVLIRECFAWGNRIGEPSAVMFRREAGGRGFNADYPQLVDMEMWFYLLTKGAAVFLPDLLCRVRRHGQQFSQTNICNGRIVEDKQKLFRQMMSSFGAALSIHEKVLWDARMASSIVRVRLTGGNVNPASIREVFYRPILHCVVFFLSVAWPVVQKLRYRYMRIKHLRMVPFWHC